MECRDSVELEINLSFLKTKIHLHHISPNIVKCPFTNNKGSAGLIGTNICVLHCVLSTVGFAHVKIDSLKKAKVDSTDLRHRKKEIGIHKL